MNKKPQKGKDEKAARQFMTLDILEHIMLYSDNPGRMGEYLTQQIRELIGARVVLLLASNIETEVSGHRVISIQPGRHKNLASNPEIERLASYCRSNPSPSMWNKDNAPEEIKEILSALGYQTSIVIPLVIGNNYVGVIMALELLDIFGTDRVVEVLEPLAGVTALILRNALLFETQESTIEERTFQLSVQNQINNVFLTITDDNMYVEVLNILLHTLKSKFGIFGHLDDDGNLVVPNILTTDRDQQQSREKNIKFLREAWGDTTWSQAINEKRITWSNKPVTDIIEGYIPINRYISLPIINMDTVIGLIQVANKKSDYTDKDLELIEMIGIHIAPILNARLQRDKAENERKFADEKIQQQFDELERSRHAMLSILEDTKRIDTALREEEKLLRTIAENFPNSYLSIIEKNLTIGFSSGQEFKKQGLDPKNFVGLTLEEIFREHSEVVKQHYLDTFNGKETTFELIINDQYQLYRTVPLPDETGEIQRILAVVENITDRRRAEEERFEMLARFSGFAEASQYGMGMADLDGHIIYVNSTLVQILGEKSAEDCLGKHFPTTYYSKLMTRKLQEEVMPALMNEGHWHGELELLTVDGRIVPTDENYFIIRDEQGKPIYLADIMTDITERKQAQALVSQRTEELNKFFNISLDLLCIAGTDGYFRKINPVFEEILGYSHEELLSKPFLDFVHPDDVESTLEAVSSLASQKEVIQFLNRYRCKDGTYRWIEWSSAPSGDTIYAAARDITDRKHAEEELKKHRDHLEEMINERTKELVEKNKELKTQRKQVEEANKLKSEFLSNMSHELRTPLNSIMALSRVLIMQAKDKLSDDENNYLEIVERNGKQLLSLINDILDLSKIEAGKMDINPQFISIANVLNIIKENMQTLADEKSLTINLEIPNNLPQVETDETRLHQAILNIVSNAVKFTDAGSVDISVKCNQENIYIEVKDTGIGISTENLPHIFDEFRQVDGSSSRQFEGTGLGLAIASKMIKILGGKIDVKSKLGKGSVFRISLPIIWYEKIEFPQDLKLNNLVSPAESRTILVVDDDQEIVDKISKYLEESGYKTICATSGNEALKLAVEFQPFAITLDVFMPEMDGWEVLQKLKSKPLTKDIPVIIVTVSDNKETGFALGADSYIQKPVNKQILISEILRLNKATHSVMIIDDNEIDLKQMSDHLKAERIHTILAGGGKEGIELLKKQIPDVLVLDLLRPEIDGFMVLRNIRKSPEMMGLPVVIVSAKDFSKEDKERLSGNVSSVLSKSDTTPQELFKEIKRILNELEETQKIPEIPDSKLHILLVEDNEKIIKQVKTVLGKEGFIVDVAKGGRQAFEFIKETIPDAIILDLMLRDNDGFKILENLINTERTEKVPVLILTAKNLTKDNLKKLSSNNIQQLIFNGDIDNDGLIIKVKLMLDYEQKWKENEMLSKGDSERIELLTKKSSNDTGLPYVLIVEDNPDNMTTIKAILKGQFHISEAVDGEQGLMMTQYLKPDIVLLDMALPKMDGEDVVRILKSKEETINIPVIALTARAMKEDKERILKAGCDGYITKPIDHKALLNEINKLLKK